MYKTLLIIGIGISIISFVSCDKTDDNGTVKTYYKYKNSTTQNVEIKAKVRMIDDFTTYVLAPNEEKVFESICEGEGNKGICSEFIANYELTFKFITDNKCLVNFSKINSEALYDNFSTEMYNNNENTLLYIIDQEEVDEATVCN